MAESVQTGQVQVGDFSQASDLSASDRAFQQLRRDILRGTYRRGTPLPERPLAQALGVSRTPLREAFRRLQAEGLVTHQNGKGVVVTGLAPEEIAEIFLIRGALEGLAASLAAQRMSEQEAALLCNKAEQLLQAVQAGTRGDALDEGHLAFNEALYRGARSPRLHRYLMELRDYIGAFAHHSYESTERALAAQIEHVEIARAIAEHDAPLAEYLTRRHVQRSMHSYLKWATQK